MHDSSMNKGAEPALTQEAAPVLVLDLDGTLSRSDTLHEALFTMIAAFPPVLLRMVRWVLRGKSAFKRKVADRCVIPGDGLPLNDDVLDLARQARAEGRRVVLVSASDQRQVDAVARHVGLFDEAFGTGSDTLAGRNLGGAAKAAFLQERYGARGFDYVGDAEVDVPVWAVARRAITVGAGPSLRHAAEAANPDTVHIAPPLGALGKAQAYLRAMRPHQWSKNLLVFLPILSAHELSEFGAAVAAFVAFSLTASSVYLLNDLVDLQADRAHPRKRLRPFAAGTVPIMHGFALAMVLLVLAVAISLAFTPLIFIGALASYYVVTFAYSLWLKRMLIIDVLTLATLYTARIIAGAVATTMWLSPWMLGFSMFLFLSLAAVKRQAELTDQLKGGRDKSIGRAYEVDDLPVLRGIALSAGYAAVLVFALYISSPGIKALYNDPRFLWLICPLLLYWISRMVMMTHRGFMTDDPIVYAASDRVSQVVILLCVGIVLVAGSF